MIVQLVFAGLLASLCAATNLQYPEKEPCIIINLDGNNTLSWTPENGTAMAIPNWSFTGGEVTEGNCSGPMPYLEVLYKVDNGTIRFNFNNASGKVDVDIILMIEPDIVFKGFNNTDNSTAQFKTSMKAGTVDKAFKCNSEQIMNASVENGTDKYSVTFRIKNLMIQGFGVENGTFSKDPEECPADKPTPAPNTTVTTPKTSPKTSPMTTKPTTAPPKTAPKVTLNATEGNVTCAMVVGEMTLTIPYMSTDNKTQKTATVVIPSSVKTMGMCEKNNNTLKAMFDDGWEMDFLFMGDSDNIWWEQLMVTVMYDSNFPDIEKAKAGTNETFTTSFSKAFKAKKGGSYLCNSDTTTKLNGSLELKTKDLQYTALGANVTSFSDKNIAECSADAKTSSIVPIAVGAALAGLVVIVLIAYLIGRRRNRKGYESV